MLQASRDDDDVPTALHSHVIDGGDDGRDASADRLGGKKFSGAFQAYMSGVLPRSVAEERRGWMRWWDVPYVRGRVYARFGKETTDALLRIERDGHEFNDVAAESGIGRVQLLRYCGRVRKLLNAYYSYGVSHQKIRLARHIRDDTRSDWHSDDNE